ncbi:MAG: 6-phosphogluconolactonase [Armatimonadetes bacterium]|nr:6-phosphogluconolactonase [Armatimonadota bacterium]
MTERLPARGNAAADQLTPAVRPFPDVASLARAAAHELCGVVASALAIRPLCHVVLSGGRAPRELYRALATDFRDEIPWDRVHLFWADERYVPADDPRSNYRLSREALLDHVPVPQQNVHPMPTDLPDAEDAAEAYAQILRAHFSGPWPRFDLVLLGLGSDGHTASLFPGSRAVAEKKRWVISVRAPVKPSRRLTLTLPVINRARMVWFLVSGAEKASALRRVLVGSPAPQRCPAAGVRPINGVATWWTDAAAASGLRLPGRPPHPPLP